MEAMERVDRTRDRIQTAVRYAKLLLSEAEPTGLLQLAGSVKTQMQLLHGTATRGPGEDLDVLLKFETSPVRFEEALNASYGYFVQQRSGSGGGSSSSGPSSKPVSSLGLPTPSSTPQPPSPTHSSPLEGPGPHGTHGGGPLMGGYHAPMMKSGADLTHLPPNLSPALQQQQQQQSQPQRAMDLNSMAGHHLNMTSIQEYNLQQLASLAGKAECQPNHHHHQPQHQSTASMLQQMQEQQQLRLHLQQQQLQRQRGTPSPHSVSAAAAAPSPFMLADLLSGDMNNMQALSNLQALAKLGSHGKCFDSPLLSSCLTLFS